MESDRNKTTRKNSVSFVTYKYVSLFKKRVPLYVINETEI
jgi:hypothetical protein